MTILEPLAGTAPAVWESLDDRFAGIRGDKLLERLWTGGRWVEGPVYSPAGRYLLWSDIPNDRILRWDEPTGSVGVFRQPAGNTNGHTVDGQGRLVSCEHGGRRVTRTEHDGSITVLADRFDGKRLNSPNDLVYDRHGALYFTDPPYGLPGTFKDPGKELDFQGVYRVGKDGKVTLLTKELEAPNGLAFTPDYKTLFVANSQKEKPIWKAFPVKADGSLGPSRVFADASQFYKEGDGVPDGMKVDAKGHVFATGPGGVLVYMPDGKLLGRILTGVPTANVAWGEDGSTLFVTANHRVLRLKTRTQGVPLPSAK